MKRIIIGLIFLITTNAHADGATVAELMGGAGANAQLASMLGETRGAALSAAGTVVGTATVIKASVNTFTTVTTASAEGAKLPTKAAVFRDDITIVNYGAGILKVYPHTGGTINNGSTNAAVTIQSGGSGRFRRTSTTAWSAVGVGVADFQPTLSGLTAAGVAIGDALALTAVFSNVTTTAAGTGVGLWDAPVGTYVCVRNGGANALLVYPHGASGVINGGAGGAAVSVATLATACFFRATSGASGVWAAFEAAAA